MGGPDDRPAEPIPLFDLTAQNGPLLPAVREAFERLLAQSAFVRGDEVEALERELAAAIGCAHAIAVSSGTDALTAALMALGVGPGDEVVTTAFTFFATAGSIARLGARPVFVDIDPVTFHVDLARVPAAVTERTKAILAVHLYGQPADMAILRELAGAFAIPIVEDAAQAFLAETGQGRVGTLGAVGCFSLDPGASLGGFGDGGLLTTDDGDLAERLRTIRADGARQPHVHEIVGASFRMDALQAAALRVKLPHVAGWAEARRRRASLYELLLMESGLTPASVVPPRRIAPGHVHHRYVIRVPRRGESHRDGLRAFLTERGIGTAVDCPIPLHLQPCFATLGQGPGSLPVAERAADEVLALPMYAELQDAQIERVVEAIAAYFET